MMLYHGKRQEKTGAGGQQMKKNRMAAGSQLLNQGARCVQHPRLHWLCEHGIYQL